MMGLRLIGGISTLVALYLVFTVSALAGASVAVDSPNEREEVKENITATFDQVRDDIRTNYSGAQETVVQGMSDPFFVLGEASAAAGFDFGYSNPYLAELQAKFGKFVVGIVFSIGVVRKLKGGPITE